MSLSYEQSPYLSKKIIHQLHRKIKEVNNDLIYLMLTITFEKESFIRCIIKLTTKNITSDHKASHPILSKCT
jgi:hypothetical protein